MTIDDAIAAFLKTGLATQRIYSDRAPQPLPAPAGDPYIVFMRISPTPSHTHAGPSRGMEREFQFSVFSPSQSAARNLSDNLRRLIDGYRGMFGTVPINAVYW